MAKNLPLADLDLAVDLLQRQPAAAVALLEGLNKKHPKDPVVRGVTGLAYLYLGDSWRAVKDLEFATRRVKELDWQEGLLRAYADAEMPLHATQLARRLGVGDEGEYLDGLWHAPAEMRIADQREFERARVEVANQDPACMKRLEKIVAKYPQFGAAADLLVTAYFFFDRMDRFHASAAAAVKERPSDIHAVIDAIKSALLTDGPAAAREWAPSVAQAEGEDLTDTLTARCDAAMYLGDRGLLEQCLRELTDHPDIDKEFVGEDELVDYCKGLVRETEGQPGASVLRLETLLLPVLLEVGPDDLLDARKLTQFLQENPGVLRAVPESLGFGDPDVSLAVAIALIEGQGLPEPFGPWMDVVSRVATEGPGSEANKLAVQELLLDLGSELGDGANRSDPIWQGASLNAASQFETSDLMTLRRLGAEWRVVVAPLTFVDDGVGEPQLSYSLLVFEPDGRIRYGSSVLDPFGGDTLFQAFAAACYPEEDGFEDGLPKALAVENERAADKLRSELEPLKVPVSLRALPELHDVVRELRDSLAPGIGRSLLASAPHEEATAFLDAAECFFDGLPWHHFDQEEHIAFRWDGGPWGYANVMGHDGEEYGLGLFADGPSLQGFMRASRERGDVLVAADGHLENLGLSELWLLTPDDAAFYIENDAPDYDGLYPIVVSLSLDGPRQASRPLAFYTSLMEVITGMVAVAGDEMVPAQVITRETARGAITVKYPASGDELD